MPLSFDMHTHLQDSLFDNDRDAVIAQARDVGVRYFLCNGTGPDDWPDVLSLSARYPFIVPAIGLHPWFVSAAPDDWQKRLTSCLEEFRCCVGEIGLDRLDRPSDPKAEEKAFLFQLGLAREMKRPTVIHVVRADEWLFDCFAKEPPPEMFMLHAYGGSVETAQRLLDMGAYLSFGSGLLRDDGAPGRIFAQVPSDRFFFETDAPFMPPIGDVGKELMVVDGKKRNEPYWLPEILSRAAEIRGETPETICAQADQNAHSFLKDVFNGL